MTAGREPHELALLLPPMKAEERDELKRDIEQHGLLEPITLYDGKILDGVHRQLVCRELQLRPRYVQYEGESPLSFVVSKNLRRRQLSKSQLAALAVEMEPHFAKEAKKRMAAGGRTTAGKHGRSRARKGSPHKALVNRPGLYAPDHLARDDAANALGVGSTTVGRAKMVKEKKPAIFEQIKAGKLTVNEATKRVNPKPKSKPKEPDGPVHWLPNMLPGATPEGELHELAVQWCHQGLEIAQRLDSGVKLVLPPGDVELLPGIAKVKEIAIRLERSLQNG